MANTNGNLPGKLAAELRKHGHVRTFEADEVIFTQGETADFLPIVVEGSVKMVHFLESGKEVIIGIFGPGEMFAVPPVFDGKQYPASGISMESSRLLLVGRAEFLELLRTSSEFAFAVIEWMSAMLREKTATIQNLAIGSADQRVCSVLLRLAEIDDAPPPIRITLRREDIARLAGLTTETVIRASRRLAERGVIRINRGKIYIDDPEPLRRQLTA